MNNSLWPLLASSKEWLLRLRWVITGLFVPVLGALWAKVQFGYPLHIPSQSLLGNRALCIPVPAFQPQTLPVKETVTGFSSIIIISIQFLHCFIQIKKFWMSTLWETKNWTWDCVYKGAVDLMCYVLKGSERSVGEVSGPVEDAHSLLSNGLVTIFSHCSQMCISVHICW